jgi:methylmalonyl-CoA/ethylmalonyl-CoA epimerase
LDLTRIHHVAITHAGDSPLLDVLIESCGLRAEHTEEAEGFIERMWPVGEGYIQTLEATGEGLIERSLANRGPGLHHIAFAVDDLDATLAELKARGARLIDEVARAGGNDTRIAFVHPSAFGGVLVELIQEPPTRSSSKARDEAVLSWRSRWFERNFRP